MRPGRPIVHLSDLTENSMLYLRPEGRYVVRPYWDTLAAQRGITWIAANHQSIDDYMHQRSGQIARLKKWKEFATLSGFDVNLLEPFVTRLRTSDGPHIRVLTNPKLPIDLATPAGARLAGYYGDFNNRNGAFTNKDPDLHEDFSKTVREVFGDLTITQTVSEKGGFGLGKYIRTNVGYLIPAALTVAGFDNTQDQRLANNPIPLWVFECPLGVKAEFLSALWDAEGNVRHRDIKVTQTVTVSLYPDEKIPSWPATKPFRKLSLDNQFRLLENPPLLIVSTALLLHSLGVASRASPVKVYKSGNIDTAYWQLRVQRDESTKAFRAQIKLRSKRKQSILDSLA